MINRKKRTIKRRKYLLSILYEKELNYWIFVVIIRHHCLIIRQKLSDVEWYNWLIMSEKMTLAYFLFFKLKI